MEFSPVLLLVSIATFVTYSQAKDWPPPPKWQDKATMARYLVHYGDWGVVSAINPEAGLAPFGTIQSYADGPINNSSGTPYFYIASISDTWKNINYNNTISLTISQAESSYCEAKGFDPEEPTCARITLTARMVKVQDSKEMSFAHDSLFARHPVMKTWPTGHDWQFYKMDLIGICLLDFYGGATHLSVSDYYNAKPPAVQLQNSINVL